MNWYSAVVKCKRKKYKFTAWFWSLNLFSESVWMKGQRNEIIVWYKTKRGSLYEVFIDIFGVWDVVVLVEQKYNINKIHWNVRGNLKGSQPQHIILFAYGILFISTVLKVYFFFRPHAYTNIFVWRCRFQCDTHNNLIKEGTNQKIKRKNCWRRYTQQLKFEFECELVNKKQQTIRHWASLA